MSCKDLVEKCILNFYVFLKKNLQAVRMSAVQNNKPTEKTRWWCGVVVNMLVVINRVALHEAQLLLGCYFC